MSGAMQHQHATEMYRLDAKEAGAKAHKPVLFPETWQRAKVTCRDIACSNATGTVQAQNNNMLPQI